MRRHCATSTPDGRPCGAYPLRDGPYCFVHDPDRAADVDDARRLGGHRRKREGTLAIVYDLGGLDDVEASRRMLEIALADALSLDNGLGRVRVLIAIASARLRLHEVGELEAHIDALRAALGRRWLRPAPADGLLDGESDVDQIDPPGGPRK